jgi:hypothetical protein
MLWDSAWQAGGAPKNTKAISQATLIDLYNDATFAASERLDTMATNGMLGKAAGKAQKKTSHRASRGSRRSREARP